MRAPDLRNKLAGRRQPRSCLCLADDAALEWPKPVSCKLVAQPCRPLAPGARVLQWCTRRARASPEPRPVRTHLAPAGSPPIGWLSVPTASLRLCPRPRAVFLRVVPVSWVCVTAVGSNRPGIYRRRGHPCRHRDSDRPPARPRLAFRMRGGSATDQPVRAAFLLAVVSLVGLRSPAAVVAQAPPGECEPRVWLDCTGGVPHRGSEHGW